jgi:putative restriction endonuclease
LQSVLDRIGGGETVEIEPGSVKYRSAFLGAVLGTLPQVELLDTSPPSARLDADADVSKAVLGEFERRLGMWADLLDQAGPERVAPAALRSLGIYGGASGVWTDAARTRNIGGTDSLAVGLLHTGRHYPDDLSDDALLYHYPDTNRPPGRDESEIRAAKAAGRLRLPVFVVLQDGGLRTVRKGWVVTWDDDEQLFLIEFGPAAAPVERGDAVDAKPFELFEDQRRILRRVRDRPNQQRFKVQVIQRYGGECAVCPIRALELINAAHFVPDADNGTSDPRNGLPLCVNHHTALDRGLIAIDPDSKKILVASGHSAGDLNITRKSLDHLTAQPATEALRYRWDQRAGDDWHQ